MNYKHLREDKGRSATASKFLGRKITVYWNNEFENFVIYLNGKYWMEFLKGEQVSYTKMKKKLYLTNPDNSRSFSKKIMSDVNKNKEFVKEQNRLRGVDAAIDSLKYGVREAVSVTI